MINITRKQIEIIAKLIIGLGLIIFLVVYVNPKKIAETFARADYILLSLAVLLLPFNLFFQFTKWKILLKKYFNIEDDRSIWLSLFYGISGGIFTPMKSGEYFARALPFENVKVLDIVIATAVDKLIPIFFVVTIGGSFFIIFLKGLLSFSITVTISLIIVYLIIVIVPLILLLSNRDVSNRMRAKLKSIKLLTKLIEKISFIRTIDKNTLMKLIGISLMYHLSFTIQMTLLLSAFGGDFEFVKFFFVANLIIFTQIVIPPIALGELGVREGAAVYYLQSLGYSSAVGFNAAFSLFTINLLLPSIAGLILLFKRN